MHGTLHDSDTLQYTDMSDLDFIEHTLGVIEEFSLNPKGNSIKLY